MNQRLVRRAKRGKTLAIERRISEHKLKAFVLEVVNVEDHQVDGAKDYFFLRYEEFFPTKEHDVEHLVSWNHQRWRTPEGARKELSQIYFRSVVGELRGWLRAIWSAEDDYNAEWRIFMAQLEMNLRTDFGQRHAKVDDPGTD